MALEQLDIHLHKNSPQIIICTYRKINIRWITEFSGEAKTIKLLEENIKNIFVTLGQAKLRHDAKITKENTYKVDLTKTKNFCTSKCTVTKCED